MRKSIALTFILSVAASGAALGQEGPPPDRFTGPLEMEEADEPAEMEEGYEERRPRHHEMMREMMRDRDRGEMRRPGRRHHEKPRPPHAGDGAGFVINMGEGRRLRVNCGDEPISSCGAGIEPILTLLRADAPPPPPGGPETPSPAGQNGSSPPAPASPMPAAPATPPAQSN